MTTIRDMIANANDLPIVPVEVPEWGGTFYVKTLTVREMLAFETKAREKPEHFGLYLLLFATVEADGSRVFDPESAADFDILAGKSTEAVLKLIEAAKVLNVIGEDARKALEKNSRTRRR